MIEPTALQSIAGQWRHGRGERMLDVLNPASEKAVARFQAASAQDIDEALAATQAGFDHWRGLTALERCNMLRCAAGLLRELTAEIAPLLTEEQGKTRIEAEREIEQAAQMIEWNAEEGRRAVGQTIPSRYPGVRFQTLKLPVGPVAALTPWNFPVMLSAIKISAALAAGCSVILKPAEETPRAAAALVRCFHDAGIDGRVLQMLVGEAAQISSALIASPIIRKISFTGSVQVGRLLAQQAGQQLKPITLELGGHAPAIVCADADVARTVATLAQIKLRNAGQICANPSRFLVHRSLYAQFVEAFKAVAENTAMGDGAASGTTMGPLAHARRATAVADLVEDARQRGARVACGGKPGKGPGFFYEPTVLADVPPEARIWREEPFGPLIPVMPFDTLDEAIAMANALPLGLAAFGFTQHIESARRICEEVQAGAVAINAVTLMQPETPFGGVLDSGIGHENGPQSLDAYLVTRSRGRGLRKINQPRQAFSGPGHVPGIVEETVAGPVAGLGVLGPEVERAALVGPLPGAVVARGDTPFADRPGAGRGHQRRPVGSAGAVAHALAGAGGVLVEDIKRHLVGADQHTVEDGGRRGRDGRRVAGRQGGRGKNDQRSDAKHEISP